MFSESLKDKNFEKIFATSDEFRPYPSIDDRRAWESIPECIRKSIIEQAEENLSYKWDCLSATSFMGYSYNGDRKKYDNLYVLKRNMLGLFLMAECIENQGRFIEGIVNGIWSICEESSWVVPAHNNSITKSRQDKKLPDVCESVIDLCAGETAGLLSWTYYLVGCRLDQIEPLICERICYELKRRIMDPYLNRNDFWWMGFIKSGIINNWNPWCNSNCIMTFLLVEKDTERRNQALMKAMKSLDIFLRSYHEDGGCDEGPQYWGRAGGALFDCLELFYSASKGQINFYENSLIRNIGIYIYKLHIHQDYFINFADASAKFRIDGDLVYRFGERLKEEKLMALGAESGYDFYENILDCGLYSMNRMLAAIFNYHKIMQFKQQKYIEKDVFFKGIQVMVAREKGENGRGLLLAAKGGHNGESHNHNDIGNFVVYLDNEPMLIDVGVGEYTAKTFGPQRYEIWTMQSLYHNLPVVNGIGQHEGKDFKANNVHYYSEDNYAELQMDIAQAYPTEAGIKYWERSCRLNRNNESSVEIVDCFELKNKTSDIQLNLIIPYMPEFTNQGNFMIRGKNGGTLNVEYDKEKFNIESEKIILEDSRLNAVWGDTIFRLILKVKMPMDRDSWILKIQKSI